MKPLTKQQLESFERLYLRLEPENLHEDGEASRYMVACKEREIKREWKFLELQVGRKVSYNEVESLIWEAWRKRA